MRRQTQWAIGGALAGTVLLGAGTTLAAFTDRAETTGTAGATSLTLELTPAPTAEAPLHLDGGDADGATLMVTADGGVAASLELDLARDDCAGLPAVPLEVTVPGAPAVTRDLCQLATAPARLQLLPAGPVTVLVTFRVVGDAPPAAVDWSGDLRLRVVQDGVGGFSDRVDVPTVLSVPAAAATEDEPPAEEEPAAEVPAAEVPPAADVPPAGEVAADGVPEGPAPV